MQLLQLGRYDVPRRETELSLFSVPFGTREDQSKETLRNVLDSRCMIDGITQETARWPTECQVNKQLFVNYDENTECNYFLNIQVLPERVRHIEYTPNIPEPFYMPTGKEPRPKPLGDEFGTVVFRYHPTSITNYVSYYSFFNQYFSYTIIDTFNDL